VTASPAQLAIFFTVPHSYFFIPIWLYRYVFVGGANGYKIEYAVLRRADTKCNRESLPNAFCSLEKEVWAVTRDESIVAQRLLLMD
jgi:hypothetical protein